MTTVPAGANPGIYTVCTNANTDYAVAVPSGAKGCVIAFVASASSDTPVWGRVKMTGGSSTVSVTNTSHGHQPPMPIDFTLRRADGTFIESDGVKTWTVTAKDSHLHIASATAGAVCKGFWLFA